MSASEQPEEMEKSGNPGSYPRGAGFAELLDWHLDNGTRPDGNTSRPGARWNNKRFAVAVGGVSERSVRNWRADRARPYDLASIESALFGDAAVYDTWKADLRRAYDAETQSTSGHDPVPSPPPYFLGRDDDVEAVAAVLLCSPNGAAVLVQGGPGVGKTALTKAVAADARAVERFGDARWFVSLETTTTAVALQDAVARALGGDPAKGFDATLARLRARPGLVILDNLESPWEPTPERRATEEALGRIAGIPGASLLASFRGREPVGGAGWTLTHHVEQLRPPFNAELFCKIAHRDFGDDPHFGDFLKALGGLPLAIELVAKQAFGQTLLAPLWRRWEKVGAALAADDEYEAGRLTSLPHSIELSLGSARLKTPAHRLFSLLGQLPAGLCEEDRDALLPDDGFSAQQALLRAGLTVEREGRLDLLSPIRDHALRRRPPEDDDAVAWPAHYLTLTKLRGEAIGTREGEGAVERLLPEFVNMEAAIHASVAQGRRLNAMAAMKGFVRLAYITARPSAALVTLAAACRDEGDVFGEANCIYGLGQTAVHRSDHAAARAALEKAKSLYRKVGSALGEANCIKGLGDIALRCSEHAAARKAYKSAQPLFHQVGAVVGEANCIHRLGEIAIMDGDYDAARSAFETAKPLYRDIGEALGEANCIRSLGDVALAHLDFEAAREAYSEAQLLYRQIGTLFSETNCILGFGDIASAAGDRDAAREYYNRALATYRQFHDPGSEQLCLDRLASLEDTDSE